MLREPLMEKLTRLRLPGFRAGLQEQWGTPTTPSSPLGIFIRAKFDQ